MITSQETRAYISNLQNLHGRLNGKKQLYEQDMRDKNICSNWRQTHFPLTDEEMSELTILNAMLQSPTVKQIIEDVEREDKIFAFINAMTGQGTCRVNRMHGLGGIRIPIEPEYVAMVFDRFNVDAEED